MSNKFFLLAILIAILSIGISIFVLLSPSGNRSSKILGSAPSGLYGTFATSATLAIGPKTAQMIFATTTNCISRVISTAADPISFDFSGLASSTVFDGEGRSHLQAASTTVIYDSGLYGCGYWIGIGLGASSTINLTEFR